MITDLKFLQLENDDVTIRTYFKERVINSLYVKSKVRTYHSQSSRQNNWDSHCKKKLCESTIRGVLLGTNYSPGFNRRHSGLLYIYTLQTAFFTCYEN